MAQLFAYLSSNPKARNQAQFSVKAQAIDALCSEAGVTLGAKPGCSSLELVVTRASGAKVSLVMGDTHAVWAQHQLSEESQKAWADVRAALEAAPGNRASLQAELVLRQGVPAVKVGAARRVPEEISATEIKLA